MENLRVTQEKDLQDCIEGEFGSDIILIDPDGNKYDENANDSTKNLRGMIRYFKTSFNPETGEPVIDHSPSVNIRITSLTRVPQDGENWYIEMPVSPASGAPNVQFLFTTDRALEGVTDMGTITIFPSEVSQS